jgi:hypothetical protein
MKQYKNIYNFKEAYPSDGTGAQNFWTMNAVMSNPQLGSGNEQEDRIVHDWEPIPDSADTAEKVNDLCSDAQIIEMGYRCKIPDTYFYGCNNKLKNIKQCHKPVSEQHKVDGKHYYPSANECLKNCHNSYSCVKGEFLQIDGDEPECELCHPNSYCPDGSNVIPCPDGTYSDRGAKAVMSCHAMPR